MLSAIKIAIFLWPLLSFTPSVISRSFLINNVSDQRTLSKRQADYLPKDTQKPDIYSFTVTSNIQFRYANTTISNRVVNPSNSSKEVSFQVTLPESAFISKFLMVIKDKVYEAYVKEKEEAKKHYQEAVDQGNTAGLVALSARDSNLFTVSINVEPLSKVTFNLTYEQLLTRTLGQYENVINVNPGQIVKSFSVQVNIEESSDITSLEVFNLKTSNEINSVDSKSINYKIDRPSDTTAKIIWIPDITEQQQISSNGVKGQFIVRYDVDRLSNPNQILVDEGYFVHFYAPTNLKTLPKHVLFVLDISGSMAGRKIEQLREALIQILGDVSSGDFISLILFSDSAQLWTTTGTVGEASPTWYFNEERTTSTPDVEINERFIIPGTPENINKAKEFAAKLTETGGTNVIAALRKALEIATWGQKKYGIKAKPLIIFLTDGQPNVEMSDTEEIVKTVTKLNVDQYAIFSLALGDGADYDFLRKISLSNSGFARNIYVASDTTLQLNNFYKEIASPLLSNVTFKYIPGQIAENTLTKSVFNDLYNGTELIVAGKLTGNDSLVGNLTYVDINGFFCIPLPPETRVNKTRGHLEKLWSYLYIKQLLDKDLISEEKNSTYKQQALELSLQYGFVTPLTSLVVVKPNETESGTVIRNSELIERMGPVGVAAISQGPANYHLFSGPSALFSPFHSSVSNNVLRNQITFQKKLVSLPTLDIRIEENLSTTYNYNTGLYNISDILWLQNKTEIKFPSSNNTYSILSEDLPNNEFQSCKIPYSNNTIGHCRHLAHCVILEILPSFEDFVPYGEQCVIHARFVGICCPNSLSSQKSEVTTEIQNGTGISSTSTISDNTSTVSSITTTVKN